MSIRERAFTALARFVPHSVKAKYEATWNTINRAPIQSVVASARQDMSAYSRIELLRKIRYFEKNDPLVQKILDLFETNIVGSGLKPTFTSESEAYNKQALARYDKWTQVCCDGVKLPFATVQAIIARAVKCDGEIFVWLTKAQGGEARISLIEAHRIIEYPVPELKNSGLQCVDGIYVDDRGRPAYYIVADDFPDNTSPKRARPIPASEIVHFYEPSRAGQYRGITPFHSVINTLHDLADIQAFEMMAVKDAASKSKVVKTRTGTAPGDSKDLWAQTNSATGRVEYYRKTLGGETIVLEHGDEYEQFASNRPTVTTQQFWQYCEKRVCKGVGISHAAIDDYAVQWGGAALRAAVVSDNRLYKASATVLMTGFTEIVKWMLQCDSANHRITLPSDWDSMKWHCPRSATADVGRDTKAMLETLRGGATTFEDVYGESGEDWKDRILQRATEEQWIQKVCELKEVRPERVSALDPNERSAAQQAQAAAEKAEAPEQQKQEGESDE